jgi:NAD(P)-dependent dehydrogenase (short-subunit alcohol dehydrogenase family)
MTSHCAIIVGMGGIGTALADQIEHSAKFTQTHRLGRATGFDPLDEATVAAAAALIKDAGIEPALIIVTTGMLHDNQQKPEKSLRDLDAARLARSFAINTIAPSIIAKHFIPLMPRKAPSVFAVLSARVGSVSDNRTGGWHGYRASKAALNMMIKTLSIETVRTRPLALCVALHPGTVDTGMSKPFQSNVATDKLFTPDVSAKHLLGVIERLTVNENGKCLAWDGAEIVS